MRFADSFIEEIKYRNDIHDVISSYLTLKRAGSNYVGLCPFHSEKTGSFTVFSGTKSFYCFGCGAGGDVITFIMKTENLDYPGAVEFLAKRAGIPMPQYEGDGGISVKRSRMIEMNKEAAKFFHECLVGVEGREALLYLQRRGLKMSTIRHFGLGYAPDSFDALLRHMQKKGFSAKELSEAALCAFSEKSKKYYDYFRGRVMFPVIDVSGNIIAFGGRVIGNSMPKYLNTSDTAAFKKSRNLFALNFARNFCSEALLLCEGYMDVISLHAAGFENAVATCGTAITPDQARLMAKYTKKVIISYDSDEAGQKAVKKAIGLLEAAGLEARVLKMNGAKDPDEYINKFGADRFRRLLGESVGQFEYISDTILSKFNLENVDEKIKAVSELCNALASLYSDVERDVYITKLAKRLDIDAKSFKSDVMRVRNSKIKAERQTQTRDMLSKSARLGDRINPDAVKYKKAANAEEAILGILLCFPELYRELTASHTGILSADMFMTEFNRDVFAKIEQFYKEHPTAPFDIGYLGQGYTEEQMGRVSEIMARRSGLSKNDMEVLVENASTLREENQKKSRAESADVSNILKILDDKKEKK